jgi:hypothetical protein
MNNYPKVDHSMVVIKKLWCAAMKKKIMFYITPPKNDVNELDTL